MQSTVPEPIPSGPINLALCPPEILARDPNAKMLWPIFLRKVGVTISRGEHIEDRRAWIVRNFGVPSLVYRLSPGMSERARARVWWRECAACSEGDDIPDLSAMNLHNLNTWIVTASEKYPDPRAARLERAREAKREKQDAAGEPTKNVCAQCGLVLPEGHKGKYCDRACRQAAYRFRIANRPKPVTEVPFYAAFWTS